MSVMIWPQLQSFFWAQQKNRALLERARTPSQVRETTDGVWMPRPLSTLSPCSSDALTEEAIRYPFSEHALCFPVSFPNQFLFSALDLFTLVAPLLCWVMCMSCHLSPCSIAISTKENLSRQRGMFSGITSKMGSVTSILPTWLIILCHEML